MSVCVFLRISRKNLDNKDKNHDYRTCYVRSTLRKSKYSSNHGESLQSNFSTKTHKKRKGFCRKKIIEDLADMQTINNVNNNIHLRVNRMDSDIDSSVNKMSNNDSSVNSTNYNIQKIDVSTASERKIVDIDITPDQRSPRCFKTDWV